MKTPLLTLVGCLAAALAPALPLTSHAQDGPGPGPRGHRPGTDIFPAPPSVGAAVGLSYFGPPPSQSDPSQVGPVQLLKSGVVDDQKGTITLPLYKGFLKGTNQNVWYILTDVSDKQTADFLGINFSTKLKFAAAGARTANFGPKNDLIFDAGTVDFRPARVLVPGPAERPFPPSVARPGAVGDASYSPYVVVQNAGGIIFNAAMVSFDTTEQEISFPDGNVDYTKVHDEVVAIDPANQTVTLQLVNGFSFGRPLWYLSLDSSDETTAAIEANTYAPRLGNLQTGGDDSFSSPVERLFIAVNGPQGVNNPQRQGLYAALSDGHRPGNVFGGIPTIAPDYSPAWNVQFWEWTAKAVKKGYRGQLREEFQILTYVQDHLLTGPAGTPFGDSRQVINCPPAMRLN